jgi:CheY-like chemotaxis protein
LGEGIRNSFSVRGLEKIPFIGAVFNNVSLNHIKIHHRFTVKNKLKKILVVDNNPAILKLMSDFLTKNGHDTTCVDDAFSCLDALVEMTPDIIFIDLIMPRIGGDDLCRIIRNMDNLQGCYIAIISAVAMEQDLDLRQLGADALIAKGPFGAMRPHILQALEDSEKPRLDTIFSDLQGAGNLQFRQISQELLQNNHTRTAEALGIARSTLLRKLDQHCLKAGDSK